MTTDVLSKEIVSTNLNIELPSLWNVVLHNDEVTTYSVVMAILIKYFKFDLRGAEDLTVEIHESGSGVAGTYPFEIAEQKAIDAITHAREQGYPLNITVERT
jgi:ATP-dependent Clp protease adaptor protein ClpS